jgi:hypothetical protein
MEGTPVARAGSRVAFLAPGRLVVHDLDGRSEQTWALDPVTGSAPGARIDGVADGPFVYLTGPAGIACLDLGTLREAFLAPWPERAAPPPDPSPAPASFTPRGIAETLGEPVGPLVPPRGHVAGGTLYAVCGPGRVAALERAGPREDADGR